MFEGHVRSFGELGNNGPLAQNKLNQLPKYGVGGTERKGPVAAVYDGERAKTGGAAISYNPHPQYVNKVNWRFCGAVHGSGN